MKKCILILLVLAILMSCAMLGCKNSKNIVYDYAFVGSWEYPDPDCLETITFTAEGEFYYSCACGSPVDDYDLYDSYRFNEKKSEITVIGDYGKDVFQLINCDGEVLTVMIDGEEKTFTKAEE